MSRLTIPQLCAVLQEKPPHRKVAASPEDVLRADLDAERAWNAPPENR